MKTGIALLFAFCIAFTAVCSYCAGRKSILRKQWGYTVQLPEEFQHSDSTAQLRVLSVKGNFVDLGWTNQ